eukprot:856969-Karenia_brevis.AAC.1
MCHATVSWHGIGGLAIVFRRGQPRHSGKPSGLLLVHVSPGGRGNCCFKALVAQLPACGQGAVLQ